MTHDEALEWVRKNCTEEAVGRLRSRQVAKVLADENKRLREALQWATEVIPMEATGPFEDDEDCHCPVCEVLKC